MNLHVIKVYKAYVKFFHRQMITFYSGFFKFVGGINKFTDGIIPWPKKTTEN